MLRLVSFGMDAHWCKKRSDLALEVGDSALLSI
jgi:hypothetical protein